MSILGLSVCVPILISRGLTLVGSVHRGTEVPNDFVSCSRFICLRSPPGDPKKILFFRRIHVEQTCKNGKMFESRTYSTGDKLQKEQK